MIGRASQNPLGYKDKGDGKTRLSLGAASPVAAIPGGCTVHTNGGGRGGGQSIHTGADIRDFILSQMFLKTISSSPLVVMHGSISAKMSFWLSIWTNDCEWVKPLPSPSCLPAYWISIYLLHSLSLLLYFSHSQVQCFGINLEAV